MGEPAKQLYLFQVSAVPLPEGKDPDNIAQEQKLETGKWLANREQNFLQYFAISMHLRRSVSEWMTDMRVESRCIASSSLFGSVPGFLPRKEMAKY